MAGSNMVSRKDSKAESGRNTKRSVSAQALDAVNVIFPMAAVAALIVTVNSFNLRDYGVCVEYDGQNIGVITDENVLGEAQKTISDRIKYYDTQNSDFINASLKIEPLSAGTVILDGDVLADKMENVISNKFEESPVEVEEEITEEDEIEGKVKAFAIRVDGELLGAVTDYEPIEKALDSYKTAYNNNDYIKVEFEKEVVYDLEEYVDPESIVAPGEIIKTILGRVGTTEYYEVKDGDFLSSIAAEHEMSLAELTSCYATYEGKPVELGGDMLKTGTMIQFSTTEPYLDLECTKEESFRTDIDFPVERIQDDTLPLGEQVVEVEGIKGERRSRVLVTYRNNIPVRRKVLETNVYSKPVKQIVRIGIGPSINYNVAEFKLDVGQGQYCWPVEGGYISAHIGDGRNHKGLDIAAPYGTPIYAAEAGTVYDAGEGWCGGYGNNIKILNDDGNVCVYAHQAELAAGVGDHVEKGQLIGYVGSTGDSTGNHLHFEVRQDGYYLDPEEFVSQ